MYNLGRGAQPSDVRFPGVRHLLLHVCRTPPQSELPQSRASRIDYILHIPPQDSPGLVSILVYSGTVSLPRSLPNFRSASTHLTSIPALTALSMQGHISWPEPSSELTKPTCSL